MFLQMLFPLFVYLLKCIFVHWFSPSLIVAFFLNTMARSAYESEREPLLNSERHGDSRPEQRRSSNDKSRERAGDHSSHRRDTADSDKAIKRVLEARSYYEALSVTSNATNVEIKQAYRKLALQFHPDKNASPRADEVFKAIGQAFGCLSDPEKRRKYDYYGYDVDVRQARVQTHEHSSHARAHFRHHPGPSPFAFGSTMTPDDLFSMLFQRQGMYQQRYDMFSNMHFRNAPPQPRSSTSSHQSRSRDSSFAYFLAYVFIAIAFSITVFFPVSYTKEYSFNRSDRYSIQKNIPLTPEAFKQYQVRIPSHSLSLIRKNATELKVEEAPGFVEYFVRKDFDALYRNNKNYLWRANREVLSSYIERLYHDCESETNNQILLAAALKRRGYWTVYEETLKTDRPSCKTLLSLWHRTKTTAG